MAQVVALVFVIDYPQKVYINVFWEVLYTCILCAIMYMYMYFKKCKMEKCCKCHQSTKFSEHYMYLHTYMYTVHVCIGGVSTRSQTCLLTIYFSEVKLHEQKSKSTCGSRGEPASGRVDMCCMPCYYINSKYPST